MLYKNTKTGAIIDSPCEIKGGDWVAATAPKTKPKPKTDTKAADK